MESVFVSFVFIVVATLAFALRTVSRPPVSVQRPAEVAPGSETADSDRDPRREAETVGRSGLLDTA